MSVQVVFAAAHGLCRTCFVSASIVAADTACPGGHLAAVVVPVIIGHGMDWFTAPIFAALEGKPLLPCNDWNNPSPFVHHHHIHLVLG